MRKQEYLDKFREEYDEIALESLQTTGEFDRSILGNFEDIDTTLDLIFVYEYYYSCRVSGLIKQKIDLTSSNESDIIKPNK